MDCLQVVCQCTQEEDDGTREEDDDVLMLFLRQNIPRLNAGRRFALRPRVSAHWLPNGNGNAGQQEPVP